MFLPQVQKATIKDRGISLFHEIPEERSCNDASILPHWCTCLQRIPVNTTDVIVEKIALSLVSRINKMTHHVQKKCAFLQLKTVKEAAKMIATDKILRFQKSLNDVLNQQVWILLGIILLEYKHLCIMFWKRVANNIQSLAKNVYILQKRKNLSFVVFRLLPIRDLKEYWALQKTDYMGWVGVLRQKFENTCIAIPQDTLDNVAQ